MAAHAHGKAARPADPEEKTSSARADLTLNVLLTASSLIVRTIIPSRSPFETDSLPPSHRLASPGPTRPERTAELAGIALTAQREKDKHPWNRAWPCPWLSGQCHRTYIHGAFPLRYLSIASIDRDGHRVQIPAHYFPPQLTHSKLNNILTILKNVTKMTSKVQKNVFFLTMA